MQDIFLLGWAVVAWKKIVLPEKMCQCFSENLFEKQVLSEFGAVHGGGGGCVASAALDPFTGMRMISDKDCVSTIHLCNHRIR